ncbi:hypothetical protein TRIP_E100080 [uncultured Spirochaetota bacterium]|nr:hypothetical protein TRIP_E100080 [uncultured Spirochaetota bacterium]
MAAVWNCIRSAGKLNVNYTTICKWEKLTPGIGKGSIKGKFFLFRDRSLFPTLNWLGH